MPSCVPSGLKPGFGVCLPPSLKAGVNERQFVDDSVALVPKSSSHYPDLWAAVRDGRYVYGCRGSFCLLTPAFRLGFVMTTELGFSPDDNGKKAWHSLIHAVWVTKNRKPYPVKDIRPLIKDVYKPVGDALVYRITPRWG